MSDNYELDDVEVKPFMEEVNQQVQQLTKLKWAVEEAEEALHKAEAAYDKFVKETFCQVFRANGLESLLLADGRRINVVTKTTCSINKNDKDKSNVAEWLRQHNGAELVKSELHVTSDHKSQLARTGLSLQRLSGDRHDRIILEGQLHVVKLKQTLILLDQCVLRLLEDPHKRLLIQPFQ